MTKANIFALAFAFLFLNACIDEIDLNIDGVNQFISVDAAISSIHKDYEISLTQSAIIGVGNDNIFTSVTGATIDIIDENGIITSFTESVTSPGTYIGKMKAEPFVSYEIKIILATGEVIRSYPSTAPIVQPIDSISYTISEIQEVNERGNLELNDFIEFYANSTFAGSTKPYLRWKYSGEYEFKERYFRSRDQKRCYVKNTLDLNQLNVLNGNDISGNNFKNEFLLRTILDTRFTTLYCFHLEQYSISKEEYTYFKNLKDLIELEGGLFDPPPAKIKTNLYYESDQDKQIFGYFSVSTVTEKKLFISPTEIGFEIPPRCSVNPTFSSSNPQYCFDCTLLQSSSRIKPNYWPF